MKIAVYTIAKNEEQNAEQFVQSCQGADYIVVGDTGSTDRTKEILGSRGASIVDVCVQPWRFDVPRNTVLSLLPTDVDLCISLDLDERLPVGWRELLEREFDPAVYHRVRFRYVHSFLDSGKPSVVGTKDFIHARHNFMWRHTVHEQLQYTGTTSQMWKNISELVIEHHQDKTKSRDSYKELLEREIQDPGHTPQHVLWLGHEFVQRNQWDEVIRVMNQFLTLPAHKYERCNAMIQLGDAYEAKQDPSHALNWFLRAAHETPEQREPWLSLTRHYQLHEQWPQAYGTAMQAISITQRVEHYLTSPDAWGWQPHDLAALCAFKLNLIDVMQEQLSIAVNIDPTNQELIEKAERLGAA